MWLPSAGLANVISPDICPDICVEKSPSLSLCVARGMLRQGASAALRAHSRLHHSYVHMFSCCSVLPLAHSDSFGFFSLTSVWPWHKSKTEMSVTWGGGLFRLGSSLVWDVSLDWIHVVINSENNTAKLRYGVISLWNQYYLSPMLGSKISRCISPG